MERILKTEIVPRWRSKLITAITEQDVADIQAVIRERGSVRMADTVLGVIKVLFKFARKAPRRYVVANPAAEIEVAKRKPRQHALSDHEIKLVWDACGEPRPVWQNHQAAAANRHTPQRDRPPALARNQFPGTDADPAAQPHQGRRRASGAAEANRRWPY